MNKITEAQDYNNYLAEKFSIPYEDIISGNSGVCYNSITVKTIESAEKIKSQCRGCVNGGWYDGMALGHIHANKDNTYYIMW
jgi:hypothetical protein